MDVAKARKHTEVVRLLEKYTPAYFAAQVGRVLRRHLLCIILQHMVAALRCPTYCTM